jgi:nitrite reductase/ring-hydroxylating ferredoxin subunit
MFRRVAADSELEDGEMKQVTLDGKEILLARVDGQFYAMDDICTHAHCNLSSGFLQGPEVMCPCHFAKFDLKTGEVRAPPATVPVKVFAVKVEGGEVLVDAE